MGHKGMQDSPQPQIHLARPLIPSPFDEPPHLDLAEGLRGLAELSYIDRAGPSPKTDIASELRIKAGNHHTCV